MKNTLLGMTSFLLGPRPVAAIIDAVPDRTIGAEIGADFFVIP